MADHIVWMLHACGGPDVSLFMAKYIEPECKENLWALAYFARCPSERVRKLCHNVILKNVKEPTKVVLASICLAKLGSKKGMDYLVKNITQRGVYGWAQTLARPVLEERMNKARDKSKKLSLKRLLKKMRNP